LDDVVDSSNRFGRWLSADWSAVPVAVPYANLTNPQTLNLYAMVFDDPESSADLDGHHCTVDGEEHNFVWCAAHWAGWVETKKEADDEAKASAQLRAAELANWQRGHPGASPVLFEIEYGIATTLPGPMELSAAGGAAEGLVRIVEQDGNVFLLVIKGAKGDIQVATEITREGERLILKGTHIQGAGKGTSSLSELRDAARILGKQQGVKEVVIEGGARTSGANVGKTPIPITIKVD
jgi:hypothetical protein